MSMVYVAVAEAGPKGRPSEWRKVKGPVRRSPEEARQAFAKAIDRKPRWESGPITMIAIRRTL